MVKRSHFFDIDAILDMNSKAWVVDKNKPNIPIMKISKSDFNLYKDGIFRKQGNRIDFNGKTFWLPNAMVNKLKVKTKNYKTNFADLAISLQEFMNKDIIDNLEFDLNLDLISSLKNTTDDIYVICSKQTKLSHELIIEKIKEKMKEAGLKIKNFYFISETFYNQKQDEIDHKKIRLLIQHLIGYRTDGDKFTDEEITRYDVIEYYDTNLDTLYLAKEVNTFLNLIWRKSDDGLKSVIKEDVLEFKPQLIVNKVGDNEFNKIQSEKVNLMLSNLIKTFESFNIIKESLDTKGELDNYYSNIELLEDFLLDLKDEGDEVKVSGKPGEKLNPDRHGPNYYMVEIRSIKSDIEDRINWPRLESKFKLVKKKLMRLKLKGRSNVFEMVLTKNEKI